MQEPNPYDAGLIATLQGWRPDCAARWARAALYKPVLPSALAMIGSAPSSSSPAGGGRDSNGPGRPLCNCALEGEQPGQLDHRPVALCCQGRHGSAERWHPALGPHPSGRAADDEGAAASAFVISLPSTHSRVLLANGLKEMEPGALHVGKLARSCQNRRSCLAAAGGGRPTCACCAVMLEEGEVLP